MRYFWLMATLAFLLGRQGYAQQRAELTGTWVGNLQVGTTAWPVRFYFPPPADSAAQPTVDLPVQGQQSLHVDYMRAQGDSLQIVMRGHQAQYKARFTPNPRRLMGTWLMPGAKILLMLRPLPPDSLPVRPQEPRGPLLYDVLPVTFAGGEVGITLKGTITAPAGRKRRPAVVLISGSGPHNRDGLAFDHKPFLVLADYLTRRGYVVLRYDERGVGESTGQFGKARTQDFAQDVAAAVRALRRQPKVDARQIYLLGHSQGSFEAAIVAAADPAIAGLIQLAGVGTSGLALWQTNYQASIKQRNLPAPPEEQPYIEAIMAAAASTPDSAAAVAQMREKLRSLTQDPTEINQAIAYFAPTYLEHMTHDILTFNPQPYLRKIQVPVLALTGDSDTQAPGLEQHAAFAAALPQGKKQLTSIILPHTNHFMQTITPVKSAGYGESYGLEETLAPSVLEAIGQWLNQHVKR